MDPQPLYFYTLEFGFRLVPHKGQNQFLFVASISYCKSSRIEALPQAAIFVYRSVKDAFAVTSSVSTKASARHETT